MKYILAFVLPIFIFTTTTFSQKKLPAKQCNVLAYYTGDSAHIDSFNVSQLTHIIFSFAHLRDSSLHIENARDSATITKLVSLKNKYPDLKIIISMGGWSACQYCSQTFNTDAGRKQFAASSKQILDYFNADGIDLDWEYPAIEGFPGHQFLPEDKQNFTALVAEMRKQFGTRYEISFAAGGFTSAILHSFEWSKVMPIVNRVNVMTYDLVSGYAKVSGHHTPLYSTPQQVESIDHAVHLMDSLHVPRRKIVIGAAFYARIFQLEDTLQNGLYQPCTFLRGVDYKHFDSTILNDPNYVYHWDATAHAPYYFNAKEKLLVTFDDKRSLADKTKYAIKKGLDGIMFWELTNDVYNNGLAASHRRCKKGQNQTLRLITCSNN